MKITAILYLMVFAIPLFSQSGQKSMETYDLNSETFSGVVINTEMIKRFYDIYDSVEIFTWSDFIQNNSFDDVKTYFNLYQNMDMNITKQESIFKSTDVAEAGLSEIPFYSVAKKEEVINK